MTDSVLMPREATREMTMAGCDSLPSCEHVFGHAGEMLRNAYRKMVEVGHIPDAAQSAQVRDPNEIAFELCEKWQKSKLDAYKTRTFSLDELSAFMSGVIAALAQPSPAAPVEIPGFTIDALRKQALRLPPADQFKLAFFIAENVGYVLAPEPEHPDSPHRNDTESVSHYVENYRFEFDDGRQYTPNEQGKALLEDAIEGYISILPHSSAVKATAPWVCCTCDAPLSCAACGVEQPNDSEHYRKLQEENDRLRAVPQGARK